MSGPHPRASRKLYGRRRGHRLRPGRARLVDTLLPHISVDLPPARGRIDPAALFEPPTERLWLEVGFGAGEHLAWQAAHNPDVGLIGCEVFLNGIASLLRFVNAEHLRNVRILRGDARDLIDALPDRSVERVFVLFPDPWPKARHAARRFVSPANLDALARVMRARGELRIATDHPVYRDWTLEQMAARGDFTETGRWAGADEDRPADWPETRYERKAAREGRPSALFSYGLSAPNLPAD